MKAEPTAGNAPRRHILQWHITHRCNLSCAHCYQRECAAQTDDGDLAETVEKYERFLRKNGLYGHVYLTGGEPLTHPSFFALAEELRRRDMLVSVLTNGTLIGEAEANRLAWLGVEFVQVSLDGTEKIHDGIRGEYSFVRALRGIDALTAEGVKVAVSFTAQKANLRSFPALAKICAAHGVGKLWWDRVVTDTPERTAALALTTEEFERFCKKTARLRGRYRRGDGGSMISCERSLQFLCGGRCYTCHPGTDMVTVTADGSVMPCRRLPLTAGNLRDGELDEILSASELVRSLRNAPVPADCAGCPHAEFCRGGAKCVTYGQTGSLTARDVNCFYKIKERR